VSYGYDTMAGTAPCGARQGGTLNTTDIRTYLGSIVSNGENFDTTFLYSLDHVFDEITFGDTGPNLGLCHFPVYQRLKHAMYNLKRFDMQDTMRADPGFRHVNFNGIPVAFDRALPTSIDAANTSTWYYRMYFLNLDFMNYYIHSSQNFRFTDAYELLPKQNAFSQLMFLKSQLMCLKSNAHSVLHSIIA